VGRIAYPHRGKHLASRIRRFGVFRLVSVLISPGIHRVQNALTIEIVSLKAKHLDLRVV
jgi:hypothetical protein